MTPIRAVSIPLLLAGASILACDLGITGQDAPETARVTVDGTTDTETASLVSSNSFQVTTSGERPDLIESDTAEVELPFDGRFDLGEGVRFYVRTLAPDSSEATLTMRVFIGDDEHYNQTRTVTEHGLEFQYVYQGFGP